MFPYEVWHTYDNRWIAVRSDIPWPFFIPSDSVKVWTGKATDAITAVESYAGKVSEKIIEVRRL